MTRAGANGRVPGHLSKIQKPGVFWDEIEKHPSRRDQPACGGLTTNTGTGESLITFSATDPNMTLSMTSV